MKGLLAAVRTAAGFAGDGATEIHEEEFGGHVTSVARPAGSSRGIPIVVLHGVTPEADRDPRMLRFLGGLASAGFAAYGPRLKGMAEGKLLKEDIDRLVHFLEALGEETDQEIGLVSFSVGGGYALLAATREELFSRLAFVCSIGGYANLSEIVAGFFDTSDPALDAGPWSRVVCFHSFSVEKRLEDEDRQLFTKMAQLPCSDSREDQLLALGSDLSTRGQVLFNGLINGEPWVRDTVLEDLEETGMNGEMSPLGHLDRISCPVFLLHGRKDPTISWEQTKDLNQAFIESEKPPRRYRISQSFGHVQPGKLRQVTSQFGDLLFFGSFLKLAIGHE